MGWVFNQKLSIPMLKIANNVSDEAYNYGRFAKVLLV